MKYPSFIGPSYSSQSVTADCQTLMNWYVEQIEPGSGTNTLELYSKRGSGNNVFALYPTPGLKTFVDLGGLSVRGIFSAGGRSFAVSGTNFFEILPNGTFTNRGTVSNDSLPVSMTASEQQLLLASAGNAYVFDLMANTLVMVPGSNFGGPVSVVGYSDGFFLALVGNSSRWNVSNTLDATTWPGVQTTIINFLQGNAISMIVSHREAWFFGATNTVVYYDSGNFPFPYDVNTSADIEQGIAAKYSPVILDNTVFWLGSDARGQGIVWKASGYTPSRVSNHAIEYAMQGYDLISDAVGYSYQDQGHSFYVLHFPTPDKTWVYDVATGMWHERGYWDTTNARFTAHRSQCHTFNFGRHLVGDWKSGKVYQMEIPTYSNGSWLFGDDDGNPIRRVRRAPHIANEQKWAAHSKIQILLETGLGPIPPLSGNEAPTQYIIADSNGAIWKLGVDNSGILTTASWQGSPQTLFLNDSVTGTTSWKVTVSTIGVISALPVAFNPIYPIVLQMVSSFGTQRYSVQVTNIGILNTTLYETISRAPQMILRWSSDGGHTFGNEHILNCGKSGEYRARAIQRRLGRARDRVYEISCADPVPFRIIDAYLEVASGQ